MQGLTEKVSAVTLFEISVLNCFRAWSGGKQGSNL